MFSASFVVLDRSHTVCRRVRNGESRSPFPGVRAIILKTSYFRKTTIWADTIRTYIVGREGLPQYWWIPADAPSRNPSIMVTFVKFLPYFALYIVLLSTLMFTRRGLYFVRFPVKDFWTFPLTSYNNSRTFDGATNDTFFFPPRAFPGRETRAAESFGRSVTLLYAYFAHRNIIALRTLCTYIVRCTVGDFFPISPFPFPQVKHYFRTVFYAPAKCALLMIITNFATLPLKILPLPRRLVLYLRQTVFIRFNVLRYYSYYYSHHFFLSVREKIVIVINATSQHVIQLCGA